MIRGTFVLEDIIIEFRQSDTVENTVNYMVIDTFNLEIEEFIDVPSHAFYKALSIAIHNDGEPNYIADYPDAEKIMGKIRWIP